MGIIDLTMAISQQYPTTEQEKKTLMDKRLNQQVREFQKMTMEYPVQTPYDIIQVIYVNHCKLVIILSKCTFQKYCITIYNCVNNTIS